MSDLPSTLSAGGVVLTRVDPVQVEAILEAVQASIVDLHRWQPWAHMAYDRTDAMWWASKAWLGWQDGTQYTFVVQREGDPRMLGTVGVNMIRDGQANLGYWTRSDAVGQGLATTAAQLCARFAFEHAGLRRLHLHHHVDNHGSRRVAEKTGFVREGTHREVAMLHGEPIDAVFYSLIGPDEVVAPVTD